MSTPLSFCDISARFGQTPAPRETPAEQTGWDFGQLFLDYLRKVRLKHEEDREDAEEDALMAMIDAMNPPKDRRPDPDMVAAQALRKAGEAVSEEEEGKTDPARSPSVQAILALLGDRVTFEGVDDVLRDREEQIQKERLEVTEERVHSGPGDPDNEEKEV